VETKKTRTYGLGHSTLTLVFGDITKSEASVVVSSDDYYLSMGGGVSAAIRRAGGEAIALDAAKKVPAQLGDVVVTTAGDLPADYIFHAVTIGPHGTRKTADEIVTRAVRKCLQLLEVMGLRSIAFPAIGTGAAQLPLEDVAASMAKVIAAFTTETKLALAIELYLMDRFGKRSDVEYACFFEEFSQRVPNARPAAALAPASRSTSVPAPASPEDVEKQRKNHVRVLVGKLEVQRQQLEQKLVDALDAEDDGTVDALRLKLKENEALRLQYLSELRDESVTAISNKQSVRRPIVFVSSTYKDLADHRAAVKDEILKLRLDFDGMEWFGATGAPPASLIVEKVRAADVYVGIIGVRYGSIDETTGVSMTELEYEAAAGAGKPIHMYVMHDEAPVKQALFEADPAALTKLRAFRARVMTKHVVYLFTSAAELAKQVATDLTRYKH
jgi:O-acetyl-ADP-ribose deacetylase (regulator of RNase III)